MRPAHDRWMRGHVRTLSRWASAFGEEETMPRVITLCRLPSQKMCRVMVIVRQPFADNHTCHLG
jgi:hypothetical protein